MIVGEQVDADGQLRRDGRPRDDEQISLVRHIFYAWERATGEFPSVKRSDQGIGRLAHDVFEWCGLDYEQAEYSLRQYGDEVDLSQPSAKPEWVRSRVKPK